MIGPMLRQVLIWFLGSFTRLFSMVANNFLATKIVLVTLFVVILPIIINNILYDFMSMIFSTVSTFAGSHTPQLQNVSFSGLMGYFCEELGIIDALSVVLSAMSLRFAMSWIPFVGPK